MRRRMLGGFFCLSPPAQGTKARSIFPPLCLISALLLLIFFGQWNDVVILLDRGVFFKAVEFNNIVRLKFSSKSWGSVFLFFLRNGGAGLIWGGGQWINLPPQEGSGQSIFFGNIFLSVENHQLAKVAICWVNLNSHKLNSD